MVRTLVFHTNNVGSIPTSLSIPFLWQLDTSTTRLAQIRNQRSRMGYTFRFVSLISPSTNPEQYKSSSPVYAPLPKRLLVKKSYLILSWLHYMTSSSTGKISDSRPRLAILPSRKTTYTLTKAPMAHKTNSKEQYLFKFYNFKFSFNLPIQPEAVPSDLSQGAYSTTLARRLFPVFETNLLFLKYYRITYPVCDSKFFKLL